MSDIERVRDLAKQTREFALSPEMERRRKLWTDHNSLHFTRPPIYIRAVPFHEYITSSDLRCQDPGLRNLEWRFLLNQYYMQLSDDTIMEPFLTVGAALDIDPNGIYGLPASLYKTEQSVRAAAYKPVIIDEDDVKKLSVRPYAVDEEETKRRVEWHQEVLDGILDIAVDRQAPLCHMWNNDIATLLAKLRGLEDIMWDAFDRPEWLLDLVSWMRDRILEHIDQTEQANGFRLCNHQNQAMPYCRELESPSASDKPVSTKQLWGYMAAQEFTTWGPDLFNEFMFTFQKPILERYALAAYGCCEDLTNKISVIKQLKNLRRIAVSPFADVGKCAEQIGSDYVLSWRPNPSSACSFGVDEDFVRKDIRRVIDICDQNNCVWDVTLKDLETTGGDPNAIVRWTYIIREELEKRYG
ncbi:MAG: hypothetical protein J6B51_08415 [Clostridia bacterium]|nr:hypothetical protein [Clostridia bacterium]MBO5300077.1 hypothetical protein [Clostridia bacterium]